MASRAAILRAAAAAPGAAQPTYPPQGGSPWIGQLPSYTTEPGSGYSRAYGPFLPRPGRTFTEGAFGPMSPILPVPVDQPPEGFQRPDPRRWQPYVGYNLPVGTPGSEGYKLASFATLKTLSETYSVLRTCLERRKNEIRALDWDITLTPDAAKAYQGKPSAMRDFGERRAKALKFFKRPDSDYDDFGSWLHALADQLFVYDAVSIWLTPKKGTGLGRGLLGSDLDELWLIDGSSIRPLAGLHGERPRPPAPAYQQYAFGVPRADLTTITAGLDLDGSEGELRAELRGDQLSYRPYLRRADSPYGFSLVEQALVPILTGLRKQAYQLDFFNESTVPRVYISPGDVTMTPNQIRELQDALNSVAGDIAWAFKVQVLPPGSKVMPQKEMAIVDDSDNWIATEVAMVCDVTPVEIGLLPKVSSVASPFAAREMAQAARSIHERTATKPTLAYLAAIPDMILQVVCGQDDMRFVFEGMEQTADIAALTDTGVKQVQSGVKSIDEFRGELHLPPWGLPETSAPVVFTQMGPVPLAQAAMDTVSQQRQALTGAHSAAQGGTQRRALPAGTSGQGRMNGPVTQRQARRGGALAPAHATAEGSPGHSGASSPKAAYAEFPGPDGEGPERRNSPAGPPLNKAALAELEALERHLGKGMPAAEWVPGHIPGSMMAVIAEDLDKGLSASYVIGAAMASLGKARTPRRRLQQQAQRQMAQIAAQYRAQVQSALSAAVAQAQALVAQWIAGTLAVTAAVLASMIASLIQAALLAVLTLLWTAAWDAAVRAAGGDPAKARAALEAFLAAEGANWASLISGTGMAALIAAITAALRADDVPAITAALKDILDPAGRAEAIAVSEVTRAWNAAILAVTRLAGTYVRWQTRNDARVCARCMANQQAGPVLAGQLFPSATPAPPLHPSCRCWLVPSLPPQAAKVLRREIDLNGQEVWTEWAETDEDHSGGRVFQPHRADGTMIPGASSGMEPPRWDGTEPEPVVMHVPDPDFGEDAGIGPRPDLGSRPAVNWPAPYMDGWWPSPSGHGTAQPPASSPGAENGRPPNSVGKRNAAARFLKNAPRAKAGAVRRQMLENFPPGALAWVGRIRWVGPVDVPLELMDMAGKDKWAASHQGGHVDDIARDLRAGKHVNPVVGVIRAGHNHIRLIDGRHRLLAHAKTGSTARAYVGYLDDANEEAAYDTYHQQFHAGDSPRNKSFTAGNLGDGSAHGLVPFNLAAGTSLPVAAGVAVRSATTGRILMLQRANADDDPAAGKWELPGGCLEPGETPLAAAVREWQEETGVLMPPGEITGRWTASNGRYEGFVLTIPDESGLPIFGDRDQVSNPDDPDGDAVEAIAWWHPRQMGGNPAVRPELLADLPLMLAALDGTLKSAETPVVSTVHHPLGHEGLWHTPSRKVPEMQQLPAYHQNTARLLMRDQGMGESQAIATAINTIREWRRGTAFGGRVKVTPLVQEAAARADDEFEQLRMAHH